MTVMFDEEIDTKLIGPVPIDNPRLRLKVYEETGGDDGKNYNIELYDASNIAFIHRLRFTRAEFERLRREQVITTTSFDETPKMFINNVKSTRGKNDEWIEVTFEAAKGCEIRFMRHGNFRQTCEASFHLPRLTHEELVQHLTENTESIRTKYKKLKDQQSTLLRELNDERSVNSDLRKQVQRLTEDIENVTDQLENEKAEKEELNEKVAKLEEDNIELRDNEALKGSLIDDLEADIEGFKATVDEQKDILDQVMRDANTLEEQLNAETDARNQLEDKYEKLERTLDEVANKGKRRENQVIELKKEISLLENALEKAKAKLLDYDRQLDEVEDKLEAMTDARDDALAKVDELQRKLDEAESQMDGLRKQLALKNKLIAESKKVQPVASAPLPAAPIRSAMNPTANGRIPPGTRPILKPSNLQRR